MLLVYIINVTGWILAKLPEWVVRLICACIGDLIYFLPSKRRYLGLSNLHHAFPDKPHSWHRKILRESLRRLIEMVFYVLAFRHFDKERAIGNLAIEDSTLEIINRVVENEQAGVALVPHLTLFETTNVLPGVIPKLKGFGAIFRPFDNKHLNQWVEETRSRWGFRLLSRKSGFSEALKIVRNKGWVAVLFDQNAGKHGALITLFNRIASASELPGLIATKFKAQAIIFYTERTGFWRAKLRAFPLDCEPNTIQLTLASNKWLEEYLSASDDNCADWLWSHERWKTHRSPINRLNLHPKKDYLKLSTDFHELDKLPKNTRFWIRMPNWLGDVIMALPLVLAIRKGRPDAEVTLLVQRNFKPLLDQLGVADKVVALPKKGFGYFAKIRNHKKEFPDTIILFTNSFRGDLEARLIAAPQRFGMERPGKCRMLLTRSWKMPTDMDETILHQTEVWRQYLQQFGLKEELDFTPLRFADPVSNVNSKGVVRRAMHVGLICGTENSPEKRWPVSLWRQTIKGLLKKNDNIIVSLFGTPNDAPISEAVVSGFPKSNVIDRTGKTSLVQFAKELQSCSFIICNDTGGMHLANALGVPVIAVFGPTNPVRTGPVFEGYRNILQPPNCPTTGGIPIQGVTPSVVLEAAGSLLDGEEEKMRKRASTVVAR